jgi:beta-lactamase class D
VWLVGFVQEGAGRTYFAFNVGGTDLNDLIARRMELVKARLVGAGLWR